MYTWYLKAAFMIVTIVVSILIKLCIFQLLEQKIYQKLNIGTASAVINQTGFMCLLLTPCTCTKFSVDNQLLPISTSCLKISQETQSSVVLN